MGECVCGLNAWKDESMNTDPTHENRQRYICLKHSLTCHPVRQPPGKSSLFVSTPYPAKLLRFICVWHTRKKKEKKKIKYNLFTKNLISKTDGNTTRLIRF